MKPKYKRVVLKISGEALAGNNQFGLNEDMLNLVAHQVGKAVELGVQVAVVVGGGNFWRGRTSKSMDRATADYMGMLATCITLWLCKDSCSPHGSDEVQTAIEMMEIASHTSAEKPLAIFQKIS